MMGARRNVYRCEEWDQNFNCQPRCVFGSNVLDRST